MFSPLLEHGSESEQAVCRRHVWCEGLLITREHGSTIGLLTETSSQQSCAFNLVDDPQLEEGGSYSGLLVMADTARGLWHLRGARAVIMLEVGGAENSETAGNASQAAPLENASPSSVVTGDVISGLPTPLQATSTAKKVVAASKPFEVANTAIDRAIIAMLRREVAGFGERAAERLQLQFCSENGPGMAAVLNGADAITGLQSRGGLKAEQAEACVALWKLKREEDSSNVEILLRSMGEGIYRRANTHFGPMLAEVALHDPYRLMEASGIGWQAADKVAREITNLKLDDPRRLRAALLHIVRVDVKEGHCFVERENAASRAAEIAGVSKEIVELIIDAGASERRANSPPPLVVDLQGRVWSRPLLEAEAIAAVELRRIHRRAHRLEEIEARTLALRHGRELTDEQREGIVRALVMGVSVVTGGPGTGKSTLVEALVKAAETCFQPVRLCAPTAKAARRLDEETAMTVHRLLEWGSRGPARNAAHPLHAGLIVLDETSMLDIEIASRLLVAVADGCHLVFIGDSDQLPSVGAGQFLTDLLLAQLPHTRLTRIFRQAAASRIVNAAHSIREGRDPELARSFEPDVDAYFCPGTTPEKTIARVVEMVTRRIPDRFQIPVEEIRVLAPQYRGATGITALAQAIRAARRGLPPQHRTSDISVADFDVGDRLIWLRNDYELGLINSTEVTVEALTDDGMMVRTDMGDLVAVPRGRVKANLADAISVHKSQGSEYPAVVFVITHEHAFNCYRALVYTAITRARRLAVVVGDYDTFLKAITRTKSEGRRTLLAERLRSWAEEPENAGEAE